MIPHSDGAGQVDLVGEGVSADWIGRRVWCYGAQSYRAFGTAAEYTVVPASQVVPLPDGVSFEQGACLGIPGITAHRWFTLRVRSKGGPSWCRAARGGRNLRCAARQSRRRDRDRDRPFIRGRIRRAERRRASCRTHGPDLIQRVRALAPDGVDHIVEVAFGANIATDIELLAVRGSIATYATDVDAPASRSGRCSSRTSAWTSWAATTSCRPTRRRPRVRSTKRSSQDGTGSRLRNGFNSMKLPLPMSGSRRRAGADE